MRTPDRLKETLLKEQRRSAKGRAARRSTSDRMLREIKDFTLVVRGKERQFDVDKEVSLDGDPETILLQHTKRFAFWKKMLLEVERRHRVLSLKIGERRDTLYISYKYALSKGGARPTESQIQAEVRSDPAYLKMERNLIGIQYAKDLCWMMVDAFDHRRAVMMKLWRVTE